MASLGRIEASLRTDQGRVRDHNEDFIAFHEPAEVAEAARNGWLYIIADGVGGADAGEVASRYATERALHHYLSIDATTNWDRRLQQAIQSANEELRQLIASKTSGNRMATTMVALVLFDALATVANVGDSRAYHWQGGELRQVTKDHSLVARLLEEGAITEEEAADHPRKNVILHSIGSESSPPIDIFEVPLAPGEQLVLCSDGLTRHVSDPEIATIIGEHEPAEATKKLIQLANKRGGEDNISVGVVRIGELPALADVRARAGVAVGDVRRVPVADARAQRALWIYTAFLCVVQTVIITLVWYLISA